MADFNKIFDNIKDQVGAEAQTDLKEFSDQGKQDAQAFLDQWGDRLEKWMQLLADKQIDEDEFRWLVESQKAAPQMEALRKANAGNHANRKMQRFGATNRGQYGGHGNCRSSMIFFGVAF